MKHSNNYLSNALHSLKKIFFCSYMMVISLAVPYLSYVGITYNAEKTQTKNLIITNKGKKTFAAGEKTGEIKMIRYFSAS